MKKIGIITYHRAYSYGAQLQAYASATYFRSIGFDAEIIDYSNIGEGKRPGLKFKNIKVFIKSFISFMMSLPYEDTRRKRFQEFLNDYIPKSKERYPDPQSLKGIEGKYDCFITGSDQVWCPEINLGDMNFLLAFVKNPSKKFAYAASFGIGQLSPNDFKTYKKCLENFNKILVRETEGQELIHQMLGYNPPITLDPTFLLSKTEWEKTANYPLKEEEPYILCFKILSAPPIYQKLIKRIQKLTGYKIINVGSSYRYKPIKGKLYSTAGPREFLGLIQHASYVVTNSFHGTVFSIIFNKPFYTVLNENNRNSRLTTLTKKLGLRHRLVDCEFSMPAQISSMNIDYSIINQYVDSEIKNTKQIIKDTFNPA